MALRLWILRRSSVRSVRNEWAATRRLRNYATLVGATFSRDSARLFSTGQHNWHDRLLDGRTLVPAVTHYFLFSLPVTLLGIFLVRAINHRLHGDNFLKYIYLCLAGIGVLLLFQAATGRL